MAQDLLTGFVSDTGFVCSKIDPRERKSVRCLLCSFNLISMASTFGQTTIFGLPHADVQVNMPHLQLAQQYAQANPNNGQVQIQLADLQDVVHRQMQAAAPPAGTGQPFQAAEPPAGLGQPSASQAAPPTSIPSSFAQTASVHQQGATGMTGFHYGS